MMAGCDYYDCDVCKGKTFYDANLRYDDDCWNEQYGAEFPCGVGGMRVLCRTCAETHVVTVMKKEKLSLALELLDRHEAGEFE